MENSLESEKSLETQILHYLNQSSIFSFKVETQGVWDKTHYRKRGRFAISGVSDIISVYKGITFFIEIKTSKGIQSGSQKAFQIAIERSGAMYFLVRSLEDVKEAIKQVEKRYDLK